ncbi:D(2)-like dopamine receptor [Sinocyclocheilus grahami]|uniref:D(2)-like dopamine receptor n=1 Tax=Sinocyclocheilus grahami TaxID=75366 RepID=UPI0007ACFFB0|nr:PREDICTED: D(2)-like dopamine receptor [Sinocyclocheilus grahami]
MEVFTEYAYNESFFENGSRGFNGTEQGGRHQYNYYAMLLTLLIFVIVFGNVLVCMAVSREKALQTTTNYLIVSLAVADLLVATLVMPWVVYLEVVGEWRFSTIHCDIFVTLDVMMCTASILNLCAISIDRYTAVAMPMLYNTRYSSKRRVTVMISVVWILSFAVSCPLLFGLNNTVTHDDALCVIANPAFVVYSSIVSFYVPFIITLLVYVQIYVVLRKRRKRVNTKSTCPVTDMDMSSTLKKCTHPDDVKLCTVIVKSSGNFPVNSKNVCPPKPELLPLRALFSGVFIICWLPFFITHIVNTYCQVPPELYTAFTWLGYVNSAVNPIIYTTFNIEFRKAFIKILHC